MNTIKQNADSLEIELAWFAQVLETRFSLYFGHECPYESVYDVPPPDLEDDSEYARLVQSCGMNFDERVVSSKLPGRSLETSKRPFSSLSVGARPRELMLIKSPIDEASSIRTSTPATPWPSAIS